MFGSEVVDVGIGMALLFLFMSLIATAIREVIENFVQSRASDLERGIKEMLQDHATELESWRSWWFGTPDPGEEVAANAVPASITAKDIYEHPIVMSLFKGRYIPGDKKLPAYIPRESFALAVLDIVAEASKNGQALSFARLRLSLDTTPNARNPVQRVVMTALDTAEGDFGRVRATIEKWYDASMDRVSGWYTKRTARILVSIGFAGAVIYNVDAVTIAERLITDKNLRAAVVAQATGMTATPDTQKRGSEERTDGTDAASKTDPNQRLNTGVSGQRQRSGAGSVDRLAGELSRIGFPIGWTWIDREPYPVPQACEARDPKTAPPPDKVANDIYVCDASYRLFPALIGWIITALAIMLGAPFWFDVLNKFMIVRSTIKPREKSRDEASVDRQSTTDDDGPPPPRDRSARPLAHAATGIDASTLAASVSAANLAIATGAFAGHQWNDPAAPQAGII